VPSAFAAYQICGKQREVKQQGLAHLPRSPWSPILKSRPKQLLFQLIERRRICANRRKGSEIVKTN
jgi:hypothetical protein